MFKVSNPRNPFHTVHTEADEPSSHQPLTVLDDASRSVLTENDSPDIPFRWSVNPYRGCTHGCAYCYARRTHEYLDQGAGSDFERVILVKRDAAALLEEALRKRTWAGEPITFSGVTDCYQPLERKLGITRACVEVLVRHRNPLTIITRSPLVARDVDLFARLAKHHAVRVNMSIPVFDPVLCRVLEPGAALPSARLAAMRTLADAGVPVGVSLAPVIPGLTEEALPDALAAAREAGAAWAWMGVVRLPGSVADVFEERLRDALPNRADGVLARIRAAHGGALNLPEFGARMRGQGNTWAATQQLFDVTRRRLGYAESAPPFPDPSPFRPPPRGPVGQLALF